MCRGLGRSQANDWVPNVVSNGLGQSQDTLETRNRMQEAGRQVLSQATLNRRTNQNCDGNEPELERKNEQILKQKNKQILKQKNKEFCHGRRKEDKLKRTL
jgi:hypothetical protein